jgi:hypothetical protein
MSESLYYVTKEGADVTDGPFTLEQIKDLCVKGEITSGAMYVPDGSEEWLAIKPIFKEARREQEAKMRREEMLARKLVEQQRQLKEEQKLAELKAESEKPKVRPILPVQDAPKKASSGSRSGMLGAGFLLAVGGALGILYFWLLFDTTVPSVNAGERTHNLGLLADRQNGIVASGMFALIGTILYVSGLILETLDRRNA